MTAGIGIFAPLPGPAARCFALVSARNQARFAAEAANGLTALETIGSDQFASHLFDMIEQRQPQSLGDAIVADRLRSKTRNEFFDGLEGVGLNCGHGVPWMPSATPGGNELLLSAARLRLSGRGLAAEILPHATWST